MSRFVRTQLDNQHETLLHFTRPSHDLLHCNLTICHQQLTPAHSCDPQQTPPQTPPPAKQPPNRHHT